MNATKYVVRFPMPSNGCARIKPFYRGQDRMRDGVRPIGRVMITGYPLEKITPPANTLGIGCLLCKPFNLSELQQLVELSAAEASGFAH